MSIAVEQEPLNSPLRRYGLERCCFCWNETDYWHTKKDVAVCPSCASIYEPRDVPRKVDWFSQSGPNRPARFVGPTGTDGGGRDE